MLWNDRLRQLRSGTGVSLKDMADLVGVSEATAQRYESGHIEQVPYRAIVAYAERFQVSPAYIMGWDEKDTEAALGEIDTSEVSLRLRDDKDMVQALKVYFKMPPEKKKHVIETIHLIGDKK